MTTQQPGQPIQMDQLTKLVRVDLPSDVQRLKAKAIPPEQLQAEIVGTVMFHIRSLGENLIQVRDWAAQYLFGMTAHLESIEDRLEELESESAQSTQIEQEDADKMLMYIAGANALLEELHKTQVDPTAKQKLRELITLGSECEEMIRANVLIVNNASNVHYSASEWIYCHLRKLEMLFSERYSDNCKTKQDSKKCMG